MIEEVLKRNIEDCGDAIFWLADDHKNLPDLPDVGSPTPKSGASEPPLDPAWKSPFQANTMQDAADYLRSVPKPRKPLCKTYFAVLDETQYKERDTVLICKILEDGQVQSIPCKAAKVAIYLCGFDRFTWDQTLEYWEEDGLVLMEY
jgi:hypothetical protein